MGVDIRYVRFHLCVGPSFFRSAPRFKWLCRFIFRFSSAFNRRRYRFHGERIRINECPIGHVCRRLLSIRPTSAFQGRVDGRRHPGCVPVVVLSSVYPFRRDVNSRLNAGVGVGRLAFKEPSGLRSVFRLFIQRLGCRSTVRRVVVAVHFWGLAREMDVSPRGG